MPCSESPSVGSEANSKVGESGSAGDPFKWAEKMPPNSEFQYSVEPDTAIDQSTHTTLSSSMNDANELGAPSLTVLAGAFLRISAMKEEQFRPSERKTSLGLKAIET